MGALARRPADGTRGFPRALPGRRPAELDFLKGPTTVPRDAGGNCPAVRRARKAAADGLGPSAVGNPVSDHVLATRCCHDDEFSPASRSGPARVGARGTAPRRRPAEPLQPEVPHRPDRAAHLRRVVAEGRRRLHHALRVLQPQLRRGGPRPGRAGQPLRARRARHRPADVLLPARASPRVQHRRAERLRRPAAGLEPDHAGRDAAGGRLARGRRGRPRLAPPAAAGSARRRRGTRRPGSASTPRPPSRSRRARPCSPA